MYVPKQSFTDQRRSSRVMHDLDFAILHMLMNCCCCCSIYISRNIAVLTLRYSVTIAPILRDHFCPTMVDVTDFLMSNILDNLFCRKSWTVADPFIRMLKQLVCIFADEKYSTRSRKIVLQNNKWSLLIITISCYKIKVFLNLSGYAILAIWRNFMLISIIPSKAEILCFSIVNCGCCHQ